MTNNIQDKIDNVVDNAVVAALNEAKAKSITDMAITKETNELNRRVAVLRADKTGLSESSKFAATVVENLIRSDKRAEATTTLNAYVGYQKIIAGIEGEKLMRMREKRGW